MKEQLVLWGLCNFGLLGYFCKKLYDLEQTGTILRPITYMKQSPYAVVMAVLGSYTAMIAFYYMGQLNPLVALGTGALGTAAWDTARARAVKKLVDDPDNEAGVR